MQLSDAAIQEYIRLYREDFGEELSIGEARVIATRLVTLYEVLCRPVPEENATQPSADSLADGFLEPRSHLT
jgi:hypothetical protein